MATKAQPLREACNDKLRLASECQAYTAQYSRAVETLRERLGVLSNAGTTTFCEPPNWHGRGPRKPAWPWISTTESMAAEKMLYLIFKGEVKCSA